MSRYQNLSISIGSQELIRRLRDQLNDGVCYGAQHFGASRVLELAIERFHARGADAAELIRWSEVEPPRSKEERKMPGATNEEPLRWIPRRARGTGQRFLRRPKRCGNGQIGVTERTHRELVLMQVRIHEALLAERVMIVGYKVGLSRVIEWLLGFMGPLERWGITTEEARAWLDAKPKRGDSGRILQGSPFPVHEVSAAERKRLRGD